MHSMMVDDEDYKELAELCDKYGECQINWVSQGELWNIRKSKLTKSVFINIIDTDFCCQSVILKAMN